MAQCEKTSWPPSYFFFEDSSSSSSLCEDGALSYATSSSILPLVVFLSCMTGIMLWVRNRRRRQRDAASNTPVKVKLLCRTATSLSSMSTTWSPLFVDTPPTTIHVIFLVHGWMGIPKDLEYLEREIRKEATLKENESQKSPIVVYNCQFNFGVGRTHDGIQAGATRVAEEIKHVVNELYHANYNEPEITLSLVGFSLGGLYIRYALPLIFGQQKAPTPTKNEQQQIDGSDYETEEEEQQQQALVGGTMVAFPAKLKLTPKIFCTIATPHLGCRGHSVIPIPRCCYRFLTTLTQTKRDLFFHSNLLYKTMTDETWIRPLQTFEKRIAYANSFRTDIMVPTCTAAFVSPHNHTVHTTYNHQSSVSKKTNYRCVALTVQTQLNQDLVEQNVAAMKQLSRRDALELDQHMSQALDAMGWTKVFCDLSHCNIPSCLAGGCNNSKVDTEIGRRTAWKSSELLATFNRPRRRVVMPFAHDYIIVNSKNSFMTYVNRGGKPVVEHVARNLIQDILGETSDHGLAIGRNMHHTS